MNGINAIMAAFICFLFFAVGVWFGTAGVEASIHATIELCEKELPRHKTCELVAINKELLK